MRAKRTATATTLDQPSEVLGLETIARLLNDIPTMQPADAKRWRRVEYVVVHALADAWAGTEEEKLAFEPMIAAALGAEKPSFEAAVGSFNSWATFKPLPVYLIPKDPSGSKEVETQIGVWTPDQQALFLLWECFFKKNAQDRSRLKWCPECKRWFVDKTRNGIMVRCSTACTNKWWTIERRRQAGHDVPGSTRKPKRATR